MAKSFGISGIFHVNGVAPINLSRKTTSIVFFTEQKNRNKRLKNRAIVTSYQLFAIRPKQRHQMRI